MLGRLEGLTTMGLLSVAVVIAAMLGCVSNMTDSRTDPALSADGFAMLVPTEVAKRVTRTRPALGPDGSVLLGPEGVVLEEQIVEEPVPGDFTILPTEWVRSTRIRAAQKAKLGGDITDAETDVSVVGKGVSFVTGTAAERMVTPETLSSLIDGIVMALAGTVLPGGGAVSEDDIRAWFDTLTDEEREELIGSLLGGAG